MSAADYSGTAVIVFHDAGFGEGMWRASCPVDCGWHGDDHVDRETAVSTRDATAQGHQCLRTLALPWFTPPADPQEMRPDPTPPAA